MRVTDHAQVRSQQRSVKQSVIEFIAEHADREAPGREKRVLIYCSKAFLKGPLGSKLPQWFAREVARTTLVCQPASKRIVTVIKGDPHFQRYKHARYPYVWKPANDNDTIEVSTSVA